MAVIALGGIELPGDLAWPDQYAWQAAEVTTEYSLTGALLVETSIKQAGRPITLSGSENRGWATREQVTALKALQAAGTPCALSVRGETFTVRIVSVEAAPLWDFADASDAAAVTLKLIEV